MRKSSIFSRKVLAVPYAVFLLLFVVVPLVLIIVYAFTDSDGGFTINNFTSFFSEAHNINTLLISVLIGFLNTFICLLIGYPVAMLLAKKELGFGKATVLLFVMPMWINFVLRTAATRDLLFNIGLNGGEHPYIATMIGMVYNYLPFVILPLYTTMTKLDKSLLEASYDLGANKVQTFVRTLLPMTMPGIISASTMVFMPTMSSFVISDVMGERKISLIGNSIQLYFDQGLWHMGSLVALIMLVLMSVTAFFDDSGEENARGGLW
ncbi:MAG: ABC transporter permease [Clostridia bacterium]|nr:ABC transporter permease [Clostridia bacterium]